MTHQRLVLVFFTLVLCGIAPLQAAIPQSPDTKHYDDFIDASTRFFMTLYTSSSDNQEAIDPQLIELLHRVAATRSNPEELDLNWDTRQELHEIRVDGFDMNIIGYVKGLAWAWRNDLAQGDDELRAAIAKLDDEKYSPLLKADLQAILAFRVARGDAPEYEERQADIPAGNELLRQCLASYVAFLASDLAVEISPRILFQVLMPLNQAIPSCRPLSDETQDAIDALIDEAKPHGEWFHTMVNGMMAKNRGWAARGLGFADTVTPEGARE